MYAILIIELDYLPVAGRGIEQTTSGGGKQTPIRDDSDEEEAVDDSYANQVFDQRKPRQKGGKGKFAWMCSSYPSLDGASITHLICFNNSADKKQTGSSKNKGASSDHRTLKNAGGKKTPRKAQVESSDGEDEELKDTSSSEDGRTSLRGKMIRTMHALKYFKHRLNHNLIIQQNYIWYRGIYEMQQEGLPVYIQTKGF